ncbi:nucleotidyltransferase family protein [Salinarimonas rosea]|uniref:nucleotidyltransferase family protein n=1 Tax=Salinarimonas rosea TaxID=552063 RepID=UPI00042839F0|nr:nucleotidyltransferase family protein [Salinarimonas rosea]
MSVAAIVLAAGRGSRFGEAPKLLATLDGVPLVRRVAQAALASRADPVIVVVGRRGEDVAAALAGLAVRIVDNPAWDEGLSTSLQAGFAALPDDAHAAIVCLGDMPLVTPALVDALVAAFDETSGAAAVVPVHAGERGNPVLLARRLAPEIADLAGDRGAGPLLKGRADVRELDWGDASILRDVDTPAALAALASGER